MSYIDAETGAETAGLLKSPAADKKKSTRGLTALVVACAALSFFAGAAATNGLRTTVTGPTELEESEEKKGWKPKRPKWPKVPDWIIDDANKGKKDADEAYEDAVEVIEEGYEGAVDIINDVPGVVKEGTKDAIEAINDVDWAAAPIAVVEGSEEAIRDINGALPSLADLKSFLNELNVFSKIDLDALLRDVGTFTPCLKQIQAIVRDARETADDVLDGDVRAVLNELDLLTLVSDLTGSLPDLKSLQDLLHSGFPGVDEIPSFLRQVTDITSTLPLQPGIINAVQAAIKLVKKCGECPDTLEELVTCAKLGAQVGGVVAGVAPTSASATKSATRPELMKLPDLSDLADLGTDFLGGLFGLPTAPAVEDVDFDAYTGRWYNVYYNYPTLAFSQPDCATAFYGKIATAEFPAISVNNSGLCSSPNALGCTGNPSTIDGGQTATYILGTASKDDSSTDGDLNLEFTGVPRASVYSIIKLGPKTFGAGYYEYAVVGGELFLYVLARDVDEYFDKYDDEVQRFLKKSGYKGLLLKPRKNNQDGCPEVIYEPNAFDPSTPPPVLA